ncbi:MAG: hypothetical protein V2I37_00435 [Marinilabiliaceae bacterium]|jgi:hypothetical protein|nr:hypothetical protein [Marinilabiliaceae bacterium]
MKKLLIVSLAIISLSLYSCKKNNPDPIEYAGTWSGVYLGDGDRGTWTAIIDSDGAVSGTASSSVVVATFDLTGTIDPQGTFTATVGSASTGSEFVGQFNGSTASGTWSNDYYDIDGTWSGTKE